MRRRFFIKQFEGDHAFMGDDAAHHLGRVLRAEAGQLYELSDGRSVRLARVVNVKRDTIEFALLEELPSQQAVLETTLLLSLVKFESFEWALEKATELGVSTIVPLAATRSEKGLVAGVPKRSVRWERILLEASQQSRRLSVPTLAPLAKSVEAFRAHSRGLLLFLSERREAAPLRELLNGQTASRAILAIGPEGGWTDAEVAAALAAQFREASLGKLILRTETAVIAALASIEFALGGS